MKPENARLADRSIADLVRGTNRDPLDAMLDLSLEEDLDTGFIGRFFNAVDEGVEPLVRHKAGVIALSDAGAHLVYLCDAGFGLYFLGHWVRERGAFDLPEGVRRLTSHQAGLTAFPTAAGSRSAPAPTCCCSTPPRSGSLNLAVSTTCQAAGRARCAIRSACTASSSTASGCSTAVSTRGSTRDRARCSIASCRPARRRSRARRSRCSSDSPLAPDCG